MKYFLSVVSLAFLLVSNAEAFQTSPEIKLQAIGITEKDTELDKLYSFDINLDGYDDLVFLQKSKGVRKVKYILGSFSGFDFNDSQTVLSDPDIFGLHVTDWNKDGNTDLIVLKQRELESGGYTSDLVDINLMSKTKVESVISIQVPYQVYLGNTSNPKELKEFRDFNLDGYPDMLLIGFSHVTIGWNQLGEEPVFDEITNFGANTYTTAILDYNQDGYPDFLNDDQYWKEPVIHENNGNGTFTRKSVDLPKWSISNEASLYWNFESFWLNADEYPDLLVQKTSSGLSNSNYFLYEFDKDSKNFQKSELQINSDDLGILKAIHFDNDGYTDIIEVREKRVRVWINNQNNTFIDSEIAITEGYEIKNFLKSDINGDHYEEALFSLAGSDTLYILSNKETINNFKPETPQLNNPNLSFNELSLDWNPSTDLESLNGHIKYEVILSSDERKIKADLHSHNLKINIPQKGNYEVFVRAVDPLGFASENSNTQSFTVTTTHSEEEIIPFNYNLHQNYPNPFNPSTTIRFDLKESAFTKLTVYDLLGRKVKELVNEVRPAGTNTVQFNASDLASGVYLYRLEAGSFVQTKRLTLIK